MIIALNELEEGTASLDWEEAPEELYIQDEDLQFVGPIKDAHRSSSRWANPFRQAAETHADLRLECVRCLEPVSFALACDFKFVFQKSRPEAMAERRRRDAHLSG